MRSRIVISEKCFTMSQIFSVDEFEGLSPNVVKCNILCSPILIMIFETKDPHLSEVNEESITVRIFLFHNFLVVVEWKADLTDGGLLLIFGCIGNEVLKKWFLVDFAIKFFSKDDEVDVCLNFTYFFNLIVDCVYLFIGPHFSEFSFGVVP